MIKFIGLLGLCICSQFLKAQSLPSLDQDPVFTTVLVKQIAYPSQALEVKVYTRSIIYTHFRIDSLGHIQEIVTLNPSQTDYGFDKQIKQALHHLPPLKPAYQGEYILPIRFVFTYGKGKRRGIHLFQVV